MATQLMTSCPISPNVSESSGMPKPGRKAGRFLIALFGCSAAMLAASSAALAVTYNSSIYPSAAEVRKTSEVSFTETSETLTYGFDTAFPTPTRKTFFVESYGGSSNGTTNNTGPFYSAVAAAKACGVPAEVVFKKTGRYYFASNTSKGSDAYAILRVKNANNLLIRGQGVATKLIFGDPALGGLFISDSKTVMIKDFSIDYNPLGFTQGTIVSMDATAGSFVLRVHDGYPTPIAIQSTIPPYYHYGYVINKSGTYKWPAMVGVTITGMSLLSGSDWTLTADPTALAGYMAVGDDFIYEGRRTEQQALSAGNISGFYLKNVSVYASPTCGLGLSNLDGVNIDGYADMIPTGSNRLLATNADGLFCSGVRDRVTIKNCSFNGQGDDCMNLHIYGYPNYYLTLTSDTNITFQNRLNLRIGDLLEVMNPTTGEIKGQVAVASVTQVGATATQCTLAAGLSTVGYNSATDWIYPLSLSCSNFKIVHNYFGQNRSRGVLIGARRGIIQANTFENAEGYGINLGHGGTQWGTGVTPSDVTIRNNIFRT